MQYFDFVGNKLSCVFKGNWQLAGGHGEVDKQQAIADLLTYVDHGVNVFDVGDIYTGAEEIIGEFLHKYKQKFGPEKVSQIRVHTKFVPDLNALEDLDSEDIRKVIERSLQRLGLKKLHLVQFHWWDYEKGDMVKCALELQKLRGEGLIEEIGVTNMDTKHLKLLLDAGVEVRSNQIQFSLLDPRPLNGMLSFASKNNIAIFCYGVLAGGLLGGAVYDPNNRSHIKYHLMIDEVGQNYFDELVEVLKKLSQKYHSTIANVASQFILQNEGVSSIILGARNTKHIDELDQLGKFQLENSDYKTLFDLLSSRKEKIKDEVYSYERVKDGPHGRIMKYDLNHMR